MAIKPKRQRTDRMEGGGGAGISRGLGGVRGASGRGAVKPSLKKPLAEPKSAVRVKPAAKQRPNKPNEKKTFFKANDSTGRAYNKALKDYESMPEAGRYGSAAEAQANARDIALKSPIGRKPSITLNKLNQAEKRMATTPKRTPAKPARNTVKVNTNPLKTSGFSNLKRKISSMNTPANRAKAKANARGLKAANKKSK